MAALLKLDVLLADDDQDDVVLIGRTFKHLDCVGRLVILQDGEQVLDYLQRQGEYSDGTLWPIPGLVLLDNCMPRLSGMDVLCWLRSEPKFSNLPVVLLSGGLPPMLESILNGLQAAYCPKGVGTRQSAVQMEEAIMEALALVSRRTPGFSLKAIHEPLLARRRLHEHLCCDP